MGNKSFLSLLFYFSISLYLCTWHVHSREIVDTEGRRICVPDEVSRVVVLTGTCIETIYILGEIKKVVAISKNMMDNPFYPEVIKELKSLPIVAQDLRNLDIEKIVALKPDLLIGIGPEHPFGMAKEQIAALENHKIPVVLLHLESLDENYYSIEVLGKIFQKEEKAQALITHMKRIQAEIDSKVASVPKNKRPKAVMLSQRPTLVLGSTWRDQDIILKAGGINVASEIKTFVGEVSVEKLVSWNPDVITIVGTAPYGSSDIIKMWQLRHVNAVKEKRVYKYSYKITGLFTPRVVLLLAWHASKFHPDLKIDWLKKTQIFFKKFYGIHFEPTSD
ncbi:MAG: ABC transporter substrate-binding protein [Deltaproteobacteria bacterium]|nr:ABC transporter substrate-binding protein [Deltaproteobacteria bacterium]